MSWKVILEFENGTEISSVDGEFDSPFLYKEEYLSNFCELARLDPFGDTYFKFSQIENLIADLYSLKETDLNNIKITEVIKLATECKKQSGAHLVFYGD